MFSLDIIHHLKLASLPEPKKIKNALRTMPQELVCGLDEVLCLVDSGATVNTAWIEKHFPAYRFLVKETAASRQGDSATTASGGKLVNKCRCIVGATAQGSDFNIAFKDMETELPIWSVRNMVKNQNVVTFEDDGGTIRNKNSGRVMRFYEHEGVYFIKLKVKNPEDLDAVAPNSQGFQRQGAQAIMTLLIVVL